MISTEEYLKRNKELSKLNTDLILSTIDSGLDTISQLAKKIQSATNKTDDELMAYIITIKDVSTDIILENINMMKAAMDRFTIPNEDVHVPRSINRRSIKKPKVIYNCFRDKISKDNLPPILSTHSIEGDMDDGTDN
jgi:hypothetical protein